MGEGIHKKKKKKKKVEIAKLRKFVKEEVDFFFFFYSPASIPEANMAMIRVPVRLRASPQKMSPSSAISSITDSMGNMSPKRLEQKMEKRVRMWRIRTDWGFFSLISHMG